MAVVGTLGDHVSEIDPFTKHVACHRCFRRGYPKTLGQDPGKVGGPGPVPQQSSVMKLLKGLVALAFAFTFYLKDIDDFQVIRIVCGCMSVLNILPDDLGFFRISANHLNVSFELLIVDIDGVLAAIIRPSLSRL